MARLAYILDTNAVADYLNHFNPTYQKIRDAILAEHDIYLCHPVIYEVVRGLVKANASRKRRLFEQEFTSLLIDLPLTEADWQQAAKFWAETRSKGLQLSDVDLLIAALAKRLNAVIVTNDEDFQALEVTCINWRQE